MNLFRLVGRALLAALFVDSGLDVYRNPAPRAELGRKNMSVELPVEMETAAKVNAGAMVVAGGAMALGILPRLAATVLAATLVPTTYAGHPFWTVDDPQQRRLQRVHFFKNLSLFGALLVIAGSKSKR